MAEYDIYYTLNTDELVELKDEFVKRFGDLKRKGIKTPLTPEEMYNAYMSCTDRPVACIIKKDGEIVGTALIREVYDIYLGCSLLVVEVCSLDNAAGILEDLEADLERICKQEGFRGIEFVFARKGLLRKIRQHPERGYEITGYTATRILW